MSTHVVNIEQAEAWDGHEGEVWTREADRYERAGRRVLPHLVDAARVGPEDRVLDIGCGTGGLSRRLAGTAVRGQVSGIDLSTAMLALARRRSAQAGLTNVTFFHGDAQVFPFERAAHDLAVSSFGVMFFADPVAAFANIGNGLRDGGRIAVLVWRALQDNDWLMALRGALALGRDLPLPPPDAPTPFALADPDRVRRVLGDAGFVDVELVPLDEPVDLGADTADALGFAGSMGIVEGLTKDLDATARGQAMGNLEKLFLDHETPEGVLFQSAAWLVQARRG